MKIKVPSSATHITLSSDYLTSEVPTLPSSVVSFCSGQSGFNHCTGYYGRGIDIEKLSLSLPPSLTSLDYLGPLPPLPPSLTKLTSFYLPNSFPPNLTYLDVSYAEMDGISISLPHLKHLKFNSSDDEFFTSLPSLCSMEYMGRGLPNIQLPTSLKTLKLVCRSSQILPNLVVPSLTSLTIEYTTQSLDYLPPNLISLDLECTSYISCSFPTSLRKLKITKLNNNTAMPPQLTHLSCDHLPLSWYSSNTLTHLCTEFLPGTYNLPLLSHLQLTGHYHSKFPPNITFLDVKNLSVDPSTFFLDSKITHLRLGGIQVSSLPPLLKYLNLHDNYCSPLPSLPSTLLSLTLNIGFNHPLPSLPSSLKKLLLPLNLDIYSHPLPLLPNSLKYLFLPKKYNCPLPNIPKSLLRLQCMYFLSPFFFIYKKITYFKVP